MTEYRIVKTVKVSGQVNYTVQFRLRSYMAFEDERVGPFPTLRKARKWLGGLEGDRIAYWKVVWP